MGSIGKHFQEWSVKPQIPPLRYASVGMTKVEGGASIEASREWIEGTPRRAALRFSRKHFQEWSVELQIPPLRYASVGMTKVEGGASIERLVSGLRALRFIIRSIGFGWKRHPPFVIPYQESCLGGQPHAGGYGLGLGAFEPAAQAAGELSYQL